MPAGTTLAATPRRERFALPARAESVAVARRRVRARLDRWGADARARDTAVLVVSELFTNAVVHTGSETVVCEVRRDREGGDEQVSIEVRGHRPGRPAATGRLPEEECGRGLLLVQAVSTAWGLDDTEGRCGWSVWARLPLIGAAC
ncbi:hypothetical protein GCM10010405_15930 [Streptomyces macrosporus]|uniref:Histidine kinase/HSP90-like ATPase domain-containing protein n=1 Tax=Streptomyces macrosporus TaxID=44032 RepID=A0ABP5WUJ6_9ACTN